MKKNNYIKKFLIAVGVILGVLILIIGAYAAYLFLDYSRIEDNAELKVLNPVEEKITAGEEHKILTYNIGFAAYLPDFGFFMDGGTESRAKSEESVNETMKGIARFLKSEDADIIIVEEIDKDATRSHHVDQVRFIEDEMNGYNSVFAVNYDSSYLFYPFREPIGKSLSGIYTGSRYNISESIRRSLPIETSLMKFVDLDRCYSVSRMPVDNGKELVIYSAHLSAYTSDGTIATQQLEMLIADMKSEYEKGNYVICGGDFNKDLYGDSSEYFGISGEEYTWAQPFPGELLEGTSLTLVSSLNEEDPVPSCRNSDSAYHKDQFVLTVDGFIVSENVTVTECSVADIEFIYSDHNPVRMTFILEHQLEE